MTVVERSKKLNLVFYGHHKAATSWLSGNFANFARDAGWRCCSLNQLHFANEDLTRIRSLESSGRNAIYLATNCCWGDRELFPDSKGIHLIRDPRDMIVSAYYSHRDTHPLFTGLAEERAKLQNVSFEEGLVVVIEGIMKGVLEEMGKWCLGADEDIYEVRFEDLKADGGKVVRDFLRFAGVYREQDPLFLPRVCYNLAIKKTGFGPQGYWEVPFFSEASLQMHLNRRNYKKSQKGAKKGHHRSGALNQWVEAFTPKVTEAFKAHFPGLPAHLGYAEDDSW